MGTSPTDGTLTTDCHDCPVRDVECDDCMVPVLLGMPRPHSRTTRREQNTLDMLVVLGLVDARDAAAAVVQVGEELSVAL